MKTLPKKFKCKAAELVTVCEFVLIALLRDLADFTGYSSMFNKEYADDFKAKIMAMSLIVFPDDKTVQLKQTTTQLYALMDELIDAVVRLEGYIKLSKNTITISLTDFRTTALKQKLRKRDAEGALEELLRVNTNVEKYSVQLAAKGLSEETIEQLKQAESSIHNLNVEQFDIADQRRNISVENANALNALHEQMMEICNTGKIIYRKSHTERLPAYTFTELLKKVRVEMK
jgi:hypothetical protein